jgi:hypothetical protein
MLLKLRIG